MAIRQARVKGGGPWTQYEGCTLIEAGRRIASMFDRDTLDVQVRDPEEGTVYDFTFLRKVDYVCCNPRQPTYDE